VCQSVWKIDILVVVVVVVVLEVVLGVKVKQ